MGSRGQPRAEGSVGLVSGTFSGLLGAVGVTAAQAQRAGGGPLCRVVHHETGTGAGAVGQGGPAGALHQLREHGGVEHGGDCASKWALSRGQLRLRGRQVEALPGQGQDLGRRQGSDRGPGLFADREAGGERGRDLRAGDRRAGGARWAYHHRVQIDRVDCRALLQQRGYLGALRIAEKVSIGHGTSAATGASVIPTATRTFGTGTSPTSITIGAPSRFSAPSLLTRTGRLSGTWWTCWGR